MKKYWTTKEGIEIEYKDLKESHLLNILKFIEKRAEKGMLIISGGGVDAEDIWYEETEISSEEVMRFYDYKGLKDELLKRNN